MSLLRSVLVVAGFAGLLSAQTTRYVQAGATPPGNGTLAAPFPLIQPAIVASQSGDFVVVGPGVYYERIDFLGRNVDVSSTGGAAATTISALYPTVPGAGATVRFHAGEGPGARLAGFTVRDGTGDQDPSSLFDAGGGVSIVQSSPTVEDCVIVHNVAFGSGAGGVGAIGGAPRVVRCEIAENFGDGWNGAAAGVFCDSPAARFENCAIVGNVGGAGNGKSSGKYDCNAPAAGTFAGALGTGPAPAGAATHFQFVGCLIAENVGGAGNWGGGGGEAGVAGTLTLANCTIVGNVGGQGGAADGSPMCGYTCPGPGGSAGVFAGAFLRNCIVRDNFGGAPGTGTIPTGPCVGVWGTSDVLSTSGIDYSNAKGVVGGVGNFDADPLLVNYRPTDASPGIDAGANLVVGQPSTDLDGQPRVRHLVVDQGAFESAATTCRGTVGLSSGVPLPTLSVNGAVFAAAAQPGATATVAMAAPPGGGPAPFLIFGRIRPPAPTELIELPGFGEMCFAYAPMFPGDAFLFVLADNFLFGPALYPSTPAPWSAVLPAPPFPVTFALQGAIVDPTAPFGVALTNAVRVDVDY